MSFNPVNPFMFTLITIKVTRRTASAGDPHLEGYLAGHTFRSGEWAYDEIQAATLELRRLQGEVEALRADRDRYREAFDAVIQAAQESGLTD